MSLQRIAQAPHGWLGWTFGTSQLRGCCSAGRNPLLPELLALPAPEPAASAKLANGHAAEGGSHEAGPSASPTAGGNGPSAAAPIANGTGEAPDA